MNMERLDARGLSCPEPVIMIKNALETQEETYEIIVDNRTSVENITRYGEHSGYTVSTARDGSDFIMTLTRS